MGRYLRGNAAVWTGWGTQWGLPVVRAFKGFLPKEGDGEKQGGG